MDFLNSHFVVRPRMRYTAATQCHKHCVSRLCVQRVSLELLNLSQLQLMQYSSTIDLATVIPPIKSQQQTFVS